MAHQHDGLVISPSSTRGASAVAQVTPKSSAALEASTQCWTA